ncbi:hypothetical protein GCWU000324_01562 [Kingella oralis ATCC 51147]|uniref:Uncharacterized protein n=1 Tax=Kingella oralis ATCC 51147 TaxID=629741 RepID=C4GKQ6_9NEIS|nr:hypothetical protein GCWU000324_01562 [Kingella oralis ATCC 51147]
MIVFRLPLPLSLPQRQPETGFTNIHEAKTRASGCFRFARFLPFPSKDLCKIYNR